MEIDQYNIDSEWEQLLDQLLKIVDKKPDLQGILYLIGVQELGKGFINFTKEEKIDLMHIAICKLLSQSGFYEYEGKDEEGWPHWKLIKNIQSSDLNEQEKILKHQIIIYFKNGELLS